MISWHLALGAQGLYVSHRLRPLGLELKEIGRAVLIASVTLLVAANLGHWPTINVRTVGMFGLVSFALVGGMRFVLPDFCGRLFSLALVVGGHGARIDHPAYPTSRQGLAPQPRFPGQMVCALRTISWLGSSGSPRSTDRGC